jgi:hypothetical protein
MATGRDRKQLEDEASVMTLETLRDRLESLEADIRSMGRLEREVLLAELGRRLLWMDYLLNPDELRRLQEGPLLGLSRLDITENQMRQWVQGAPRGDFRDIDATMSALEQQMTAEGGDD